jgi:hypothetical protein
MREVGSVLDRTTATYGYTSYGQDDKTPVHRRRQNPSPKRHGYHKPSLGDLGNGCGLFMPHCTNPCLKFLGVCPPLGTQLNNGTQNGPGNPFTWNRSGLTCIPGVRPINLHLQRRQQRRQRTIRSIQSAHGHFLRHGADFGATSAGDYASQAAKFFEPAVQDRLSIKIDPNTGVIRIYDP